jgi:hypothetical protein
MNSFPARVLRGVLKQRPRKRPSFQVRRRRKDNEAMTISQWLLLTFVIAAGMGAAFVSMAYYLNRK